MPARDTALLIAIPTYNEHDNISELLTTLLGLYPKAHVIVIDDASPDGTGQLVHARAQQDSRIHLIERGIITEDFLLVAGAAWEAAFLSHDLCNLFLRETIPLNHR